MLSARSMSRKLLIYTTVIGLLVGGIAAIADALVTTESERLDAFVDAVTGEVESRRIDDALDYADPSREPVELVIGDRVETFEEGQEVDLAERARDTLAPFTGEEVRLLQRHVEIDQDQAEVALRLHTPDGIVNVQFRLRRHGDGWLVHRVRVI